MDGPNNTIAVKTGLQNIEKCTILLLKFDYREKRNRNVEDVISVIKYRRRPSDEYLIMQN